MNNIIIFNIVSFIISYLIFFLIYVLFINRKRKNYKEPKKQVEIEYLLNRFKLDKRKVKYNTLKWTITFINPLIMSITFIIITNVKSLLLGILLGFIVMLMLVYSCYELLGRYIKRKSEKDV